MVFEDDFTAVRASTRSAIARVSCGLALGGGITGGAITRKTRTQVGRIRKVMSLVITVLFKARFTNNNNSTVTSWTLLSIHKSEIGDVLRDGLRTTATEGVIVHKNKDSKEIVVKVLDFSFTRAVQTRVNTNRATILVSHNIIVIVILNHLAIWATLSFGKLAVAVSSNVVTDTNQFIQWGTGGTRDTVGATILNPGFLVQRKIDIFKRTYAFFLLPAILALSNGQFFATNTR
mmetsp:Transcript_36093/g.56498  ORF Transcript_36093/g.56498 Transcript_36093/m.56498 type:complete len:233 (-) Transcript_36093:6973-7671(-)